ncbi:MAG: aminopeptidase P family protein [Chloroflexota bacterium]
MTAAISPQRFAERLQGTSEALSDAGVAAMLIGVGPELEWLVGYAAQGHERLNLLVIAHDGRVSFIGPRLEEHAARSAPGFAAGSIEMLSWSEDQDPFPLVQQRVPGETRSPRRLAVSDGLRAAFLLGLQDALANAEFEVASRTLAPLRRVKDDEEVALLRVAAIAADRVIESVIGGPLVGRSEAEIAKEVRERLVAEGHDSAEFAIVASGPNSASPHHEPGARVVVAGEPLLLDIGGRRAGYCSDITRTVWVAGDQAIEPDQRFAEIHGIVQRAQAAGRDAVRPGISFEAIDAAARDVITAAGYGEQFFHRLGHGIGLEVHEDPYVVVGNRDVAVDGNTFSIEPGIYLEGEYGVRIEDAVLCTTDGADSLNAAPRELLIVSGI